MRFDDSLDTVLSAEISTPAGVQSAWRQIVDLIGRGRARPTAAAITRLRSIRADVPPPVRAASARGLEFATPPAALVAVFVEDELPVAAPVIRSARLDADEWAALLPTMAPVVRSLLRNRRDLPAAVTRALESYGATDLMLAPPESVAAVQPLVADRPADPVDVAISFPVETSFVSIADAARDVPVVVEARRLAEADRDAPETSGGFPIADLVARIESYRREQEDVVRPLPSHDPVPATLFRFETDAAGAIRWVDGAERGALIGLSLAGVGGAPQVDGVAAGAYKRRAAYTDARLEIGGSSDAAGAWRISGMPGFDPASGRFTGYRGTARRPRVDEEAAPTGRATSATDALRQLVHELRTPTNAIIGFAEMIESEMLGPVPSAYRDQAREIRGQTHDLIGAIDDLDLAARIESRGTDFRHDRVAVAPLVKAAVAELQPLAVLRGAELAFDGAAGDVQGDQRAVERLVSRLLASLVAAAAPAERIGIRGVAVRDVVALEIDRPHALAAYPGDALFAAEAEVDEGVGAPLLGSGFAFRLARNLTAELGGSLTIGAERLTLRLPAAVDRNVEQATS